MSPIWKYDERFSKLSSIKFEINLCKTLHPHFFYVINKVEIGKKKSYRNVHLFKQMLTFMHKTCEFQLWDIFVVADLYTSNYSFKMAKIGSYEYFLVIFYICFCTMWKQLRISKTDIDFKRREDHQSDLNIGLNVKIICLRIMLIGHRKDMKDCVYTNDFVLIYL